eukprot:799226-Amphidinium_carterae.2
MYVAQVVHDFTFDNDPSRLMGDIRNAASIIVGLSASGPTVLHTFPFKSARERISMDVVLRSSQDLPTIEIKSMKQPGRQWKDFHNTVHQPCSTKPAIQDASHPRGLGGFLAFCLLSQASAWGAQIVLASMETSAKHRQKGTLKTKGT